MEVQSVDESWSDIESFLKTHDKEAYNALMSCKGASPEEITKAEKYVGYSFPEDFKQSLLRHDLFSIRMKDEDTLKVFKSYGYGLSLKRMLSNYGRYYHGPVGSRISGSHKDEAGEMDGLLPLFVFDEDRWYYFLSLDLQHGIVTYLTYGGLYGTVQDVDEVDLSSEPVGRICAWSFASYLESLAKILTQQTYEANEEFGHDTLQFMPAAVLLEFEPVDSLLEGYPVRSVINEAVEYA